MRRFGMLFGVLFLLGQGFAFQWEPFQVPPGDHSYLLEIRTVAADVDDQVSTITIDIGEGAEGYAIDTTIRFRQEGVSEGDLGSAMFGGSMLGTFAFGPMMMFGPSFMMLPMMLMGEDIRVRSEPMVVMGMGRLYMNETITAAERECVVLRFEANDSTDIMEFALAEDLPFPCYTRYGGEGSYTEIRLLEAR